MFDATPLLKGYGKLRRARLAMRSAADHQRRTLMRLVRRAQDTRFGRDHDFSAIRSVRDFQDRVPLRSFEAHREAYFEADFPTLTDVTWPGTIRYFAVSSGTSSGRTKHIPVSPDMIRSNSRAGTDMLAEHVKRNPDSQVLGGKSFMLGGSVAMEELADGVMAGDLSGILRLNNPRWSHPYVFPSIEEALEADWEAKIDRLARLSLAEPIRCIAGTPPWLLLFFERLAEISGRGRDVPAFYPDLDLMVYGGLSFAPYRDTFAKWFPNGGVDWREVYTASEGFIAYADRGIGEGMRLNLDVGLFYEFVPVAELESEAPTRYTVADCPAGEFALVVSTCAGLWGYVIGDVVEFLPGDTPRVRVTGRTSYYLSAFGEHLSGREIELAVLAAAQNAGRTVAEYSVTPIYPGEGETTGRHLFIVELDAPPEDPDAFAKTLDATLSAGNEDYEVHRRGDYQLAAPKVVFVSPGAFADWMRERGKLGGQNKVPRVVLNEDVRRELMKLAGPGGV